MDVDGRKENSLMRGIYSLPHNEFLSMCRSVVTIALVSFRDYVSARTRGVLDVDDVCVCSSHETMMSTRQHSQCCTKCRLASTGNKKKKNAHTHQYELCFIYSTRVATRRVLAKNGYPPNSGGRTRTRHRVTRFLRGPEPGPPGTRVPGHPGNT